MLVALTDQNERLVLQTSMPKDFLRKLRTDHQFFCPQCKNNVQLKIGTIKIPHFAHITKSDCEAHFSEGESTQHLLGKEQLYRLFQRLGFRVELESYLPTLKQRPDLLVKMKDGKLFAIEYQCSPISNEYLLSRNRGYLSENICPIWIPITPRSKEGFSRITIISLSDQLQQFIQSTKNQNYLITYNPHLKKFIYFSNLLHLKNKQFLTKVQMLPIDIQQFPFYLPKNLTRDEFLQYVKTYVGSKENFLKYRLLISKKGINDLFLRSIYELRLNLSSLPSFIGVPIRGNESLGLFAVEWQTNLFYFVYANRLEIDSLHRQAILYFLKWANLNITSESIATVRHYCELLKQLKIQHIYSSVEYEKLVESLYTQFLA